jgi:hypothetical protein
MKSKWGGVKHTKKNFLKILRRPKLVIWTKLTIYEVKSKYFLVLTSFARLCTKYGSKLKEKFTTVVGKIGLPASMPNVNKHPFFTRKTA